VLAVENLCGDVFDDVSFVVRPGEVVGLAGLVGAGRTELSEAIVGLDANVRGVVRIGGRVADHRTPRKCQELGLVYVPEDRHAHGIFLELPNMHTTTASILATLGRVFVSQEKERGIARRFVERLGIRVSGPGQIARTLSGGNQQKIVLSKTLATDPRIIILDEPTRGIDAQARRDVYRIIRELTAQGVAILLISSELDEVIELSDRVLVMYRGRVREMPAGQTGLEAVTAASFGLREGSAG
jgi:AI-2 transport system ATP-binding protein